MENQEKVTTMDKDVAADNNQYIDAINEMKATTVAKEKYDQVVAENSKLLKSLINGDSIDMKASAGRSREELDKSLFGKSNYETCKAMVELKDKIKDEDGIDNVFNARGQYANTTPDSEERNDLVYEGLKSMLEEADGDPVLFNALYQKYVK